MTEQITHAVFGSSRQGIFCLSIPELRPLIFGPARQVLTEFILKLGPLIFLRSRVCFSPDSTPADANCPCMKSEIMPLTLSYGMNQNTHSGELQNEKVLSFNIDLQMQLWIMFGLCNDCLVKNDL